MPVALAEIDQEQVLRTPSGLPALDRVLGGGIVAGGTVLLAGEPGIGKSTLLLQLADRLARQGRKVLYASAEESPRQLRLRAERLGCAASDVLVVGETRLESLLDAARASAPAALLVDSIQAVAQRRAGEPSGFDRPGAALREPAGGPREALGVDALPGRARDQGRQRSPARSRSSTWSTPCSISKASASPTTGSCARRRIASARPARSPCSRCAKSGLEPVSDPSLVLLARRRRGAPGSAVLPTLSGTRPLLVETQALVSPTNFPSPRRMSVGLDANRVILLVAVLERFARLGLADRDVFLNVVGGLALKEPAADLAVAAALISAYRGAALPSDAVFFGEIGLLGEVRPVSQVEARLREAAAHGFKQAFLPRVEGQARRANLDLVQISTLEELAESLPS